ncbi:HTH-type transcriptional regulator Xre [Lachnospiraceae bacterium]|nr:helix-turn-helix transcriptional regulator [Acetatifactor sp.]GFH93564.1 HTH-type transcriptional regulator Xre [Lachnospiraceae bacterium]
MDHMENIINREAAGELRCGEQLAFLRREMGITQEQLAQAMGVTNQAVSKWESGQSYPDITLLPRLAAYFRVTVDELLGVAKPQNIRNIYLEIKELFQVTPQEECFSLAFRLATLLHEGAVSGGYKGYLPWEAGQYGLDKEPCKWGLSICSEPEGATAHIRNGIFFADQKYYQSMSRGDMAAICETLQTLGDIKVLKTLYALYELTVADFENLYASPEEIARRARLPEETVRQCLQLLWVQEHEINEGLYRLQGPYMHLPALLQMFLEA